MHPEKDKQTIRFFCGNTFFVGFVSFLYTAVIVFFILLAVILPLRKFGRIRPGDFIFIGLPAWILIVIALVIAGERGKWWLYPHWLWTSFKRVIVDIQKRQVYFITGFRPFLSGRTYPFDFIDSLVLTSRSTGDPGTHERFGLKVKFRNNTQWTFFHMFKNEQEFRKRVKQLSLLLDCSLSDLTYTSSPPIDEKLKSSKLLTKESATQEKPKGIKEKRLEDGGFLIFISRRHEWLAFILLFGIWIGIYLLTWAVGWTSPSTAGGWEGMWLLMAAVLIFLFIRTAVPVKIIKLKNNYLFYRLYFLGIPVKRKQVPAASITKITGQATELLIFRLVIISDEQTLKVNDLTREMALYLEEKLPHYIEEGNPVNLHNFDGFT